MLPPVADLSTAFEVDMQHLDTWELIQEDLLRHWGRSTTNEGDEDCQGHLLRSLEELRCQRGDGGYVRPKPCASQRDIPPTAADVCHGDE